MSALAAFHAGPRAILVKLNLECWFLWREKTHRTRRKNPRSRARTNNKLNARMPPGWNIIDPGPHWQEASTLTTAPSLKPSQSPKNIPS